MDDLKKNEILRLKVENFVDAQIAMTAKRMVAYVDTLDVPDGVKIKTLQYMSMLMTEAMSQTLASSCRIDVYDEENNVIDEPLRELIIEDFEMLVLNIRQTFMDVFDGKAKKNSLH